MFNDLAEQIVSVLRYLASPAVGLIVVFLADDKHGILQAVATTTWPWRTPPSTWLIAGFLGVAGLTVYFAHRTLFHGVVTKVIVGHHIKRLSLKLTPDELAFGRWERRGAEEHSPEKSAQSVLDETNAAIHFFYCAGWSALLFALVLRSAFPNNFYPSPASWAVFCLVVLSLFLVALIGDYRTALLDIKAYLRNKK